MSDRGTTDPGRGTAVGDALPATHGEPETLADRFRLLATKDLSGYCPIYERIALGIADDPASLDLLDVFAPAGRTPVLALASVHDLVLAEPDGPLAAIYSGRSDDDPWPAFRRLLHDEREAVLDRMRTRRVQTNEVGRSAVLAPAIAWVRARLDAAGDDRPLALVEIGPSAGLNLLFDRYAITYLRDGDVMATAGDPASPVRLECVLRGPGRPPLDARSGVGSRIGLDVAPVDVTDDDACRWLAACVWPGLPQRSERLGAAIRLARLDPPDLRVGDAVRDLAPLVASQDPDAVPVVLSTWVLAYLGRDGRAALLDALDTVGASRDLVLVTAEDPRMTPWVPDLPTEVTPDGDGTATVVGARTWFDATIRNEALAVSHPHGRWMAWGPDVEAA